VFYRHTVPKQLLAVELIDGIISIPIVLKLDESKVLLE